MNIHVGVYGGTITVTCLQADGITAQDISAGTTLQFRLRSPSRQEKGLPAVVKTAAFVTDGTDGKLDYTIADGDLDQAGDWQIQARAAKLSGGSEFDYLSDVGTFRVDANLPV